MAQVLTNQKRCQLSPGAGFLEAPPGPGVNPLVARLWNSLGTSQKRHWWGEGADMVGVIWDLREATIYHWI